MNQIMSPRVCEDMQIDKTKDYDNFNLEKDLSENIIKKPKLEPVEEDLPLSKFIEETSVSDGLPSPDKNHENKRKTGGMTGGKRKQRDSRFFNLVKRIKYTNVLIERKESWLTTTTLGKVDCIKLLSQRFQFTSSVN